MAQRRQRKTPQTRVYDAAILVQTARMRIAASLLCCLPFLVTGCASPDEAEPAEPGTFASVRPVLETNCVHCHGDNRLSYMPPINDTKALRRLIGPGNWIIPGKPDGSRFFQVITFSDEQPGAMPPSGHAITAPEVSLLRQWISAGAPVPEDHTIILHPRGELPRSR